MGQPLPPRPRLRLQALGVLLLLLSLAIPVQAARLPPDVTFSVGLSGAVSDGRMLFPVTVTLRNRMLPTEGRIEISFPDHGERSEVSYIQPVSLPAPSTKAFTLWVRSEPYRTMQVTVTFKDYFLPFSERQPLLPDQFARVACLEVPLAFRQGEAKANSRFTEVTPAAMPDNPLALSGWHAVMLSRHALENLSAPALAALRQWVVTGGTLIGIDLSDDVLSERVGLTPSSPVPRSTHPTVRPVGAGLVACAGANAETRTAFWERDPNLMRRIFPASDASERANFNPSGHLDEICRNQSGSAGLSFLWILLIVGAYAAVIGPLDRWVTARCGRPHLTWVFFAAAILGFSVLAYGYSRLVNVGAMRTVTLNVVDAAPDFGMARGETLAWVYSARNAAYPFESTVDNACLSARETSLGAAAVAGVEITAGRRATLTARIPVFSAKEFDASWYIPWTNAVQCRQGPGGWTVTVPSNFKVSEAYVAETTGVTPLSAFAGRRDEWTSAGTTPLAWDALLEKADAFPRHYYGGPRQGTRDDDTLPQRLRDYLLLLSFPGPLHPADPPVGYSVGHTFVDGRDAREASLDIRHRLERGPVLLLFVDGPVASPFRSLRFAPETRETTLVRLPLARPAAQRRPQGE